jgi:RHS repeat-associated protein
LLVRLADINTVQFSSKERDSFTGFYYYGFRYYNPSTGRWLNRDPAEEGDGPNVYAFLKNNGINEVDFLGLCSGPGYISGNFPPSGNPTPPSTDLASTTPLTGRGSYLNPSCHKYDHGVLGGKYRSWGETYKACYSNRSGTSMTCRWYKNGNCDDPNTYCGKGSATISACCNVAGLGAAATGAGAPIGIAITVVGITNNIVHFTVCGSNPQDLRSISLAVLGQGVEAAMGGKAGAIGSAACGLTDLVFDINNLTE